MRVRSVLLCRVQVIAGRDAVTGRIVRTGSVVTARPHGSHIMDRGRHREAAGPRTGILAVTVSAEAVASGSIATAPIDS